MSEEKKARSISIPEVDVKQVLSWKLKQYQEQNIPIGVLSDYIYKGINEINDRKTQLENYVKLINQEIEALKQHEKKVKVECAKFFNENGFDKLEGVEVSSITLTKEKQETSKEIEEKNFVCSLSKDEINDFLVTQNLGKYEKKKVIKITSATPSMIKINKRRSK